MNKKIRWVALSIVCVLSFALILSSPVFAGEITITGEINEQQQVVTKDNTIYDVADTDIGNDLMDKVDAGKKVKIMGTVKEEEGKKVIDVTSYELIETD